MATSKHKSDASFKITDYIETLPDWSQKICITLREISLKSNSEIIEDWKWGPNYYLNGMVCGFSAFKKHVNFVFFQGSLLKDKKKVLLGNPENLHNRHLKFTDHSQINEKILLEYLTEAISNNKKGKKLIQTTDKTIVLATDIKNKYKASHVLNYFDSLAYSHKKEYVNWIESAKKEETRTNRIEKSIEMLISKQKLNEKYKK